MARFQNFEEIYSALYVDFDNIYTRLYDHDINLARTFATNPQRWLRWLEGHALRMMYGDGVRRRILKRCCYLNPIRYHEFRPFFIRSAFQVVDCPPLTNYGKTSADIHLVMDCMDALAHVTRFDEIIILSGDADFTPLLLRIQEYARRSLVLSVGYTSPAYAAACSWRIREDWFLSQALEDGREDQYKDERSESRPELQPAEARQLERRPPVRPKEENDPSSTNGAPRVNLPAYKRIRLVESIKQLVDESAVPVPLPSVAQVLQSEQEASPDWYGAGTLRDLLLDLDLAPLAFSPGGQGHVYDPQRHDKPEGDNLREEFRLKHPELFELAQNINRLTDIPLLSPELYSLLFSRLTEDVNRNGFSRTGTVRRLEDLFDDEGLPVSSSQITFVVDAIIRGGVALAAEQGSVFFTAGQLREAFAKNADSLCELAQLQLDQKEKAMLATWL
ncbi:NYN domain-containing protein [Desulfovibrio sp. OttesenSCG-928-M16]|nr:NYN domain-containing protein [Desulfovibrio sp. OttesenSCG-928-M16]